MSAFAWGPHYRALQGCPEVTAVNTAGLRRVRLRVTEAARDRSLVVITAPAGTGKSFAVGRAVESVMDTFPALDAVGVELASTSSEKVLMEDLYLQILALEPPKRARTADLRRMLQRALADQHRIVIVDEAQHASSMALRNLRWLHDKAAANFALIVVGTPGLWGNLPPEIRSRTAAHVELERLADNQVAEVLRSLHPLFKTIDPDLLAAVNRQRARGSFRWWAIFLANALNLTKTLGPVTDDNLYLFLADRDGA